MTSERTGTSQVPGGESPEGVALEADLQELVARLVRHSRPFRDALTAEASAAEAEEAASADAATAKPEATAKTDVPEEADAAEKADVPTKMDAPTKTDASGEAEAPTKTDALGEAEAPTKTDAPVEADAADEVRDDPGELEQAPPRLGRRAQTVLGAVLVVLLVAAASTAAVVTHLWRQADDRDAAKQQVAERSAYIASTMYNYSYRDVNGYLAKQSAVMTTAMVNTVKSQRSSISAFITNAKIVYSATVNQVYVGRLSGTTAWAIVDLNAKLTTNAGIETLTGTLVRFKLSRERGNWFAAQAPETIDQGTEKDTDAKGNPLPTTSPSASSTPK